MGGTPRRPIPYPWPRPISYTMGVPPCTILFSDNEGGGRRTITPWGCGRRTTAGGGGVRSTFLVKIEKIDPKFW